MQLDTGDFRSWGTRNSESVSQIIVSLCSIGVDPQTFTSWAAVWEGIKAVLSNPVQLVTMCLAVLSVFIDPTTAGLSDSEKALTYTTPKKKGE